MECKGEIYSASQFAAVQAELAINNNNNNICVKISSPPAQTVPDIVVTVVDDDTSKNIINNNTNNNDEEESAVKEERNLSVRKPVSSTAKLFGFVQKDPAERPQSNTSKIFVPRTRDMNKGFLMFSDEAPGQTSKFSFFFLSFSFLSMTGTNNRLKEWWNSLRKSDHVHVFVQDF